MYYMSKILDLSPEFYRKDGCFPMKSTKHWLKAISFSLALVALSIFVTGCGTFDATDGEKTADAMLEVMNQVQSVETSITLDIQGRFTNGDDTDSDSHTAAVNSTATIESSYSPLACHSQFYSSILVDGAVSREERECYIVPDGSDYIRYDYVPTSSEWTQSKVLRPDALSTPRKTGLIYDWKDFMHGLTYQESKPMVSFYDADYKNKGGFGPYGQFTGGSYYLETLQGKDGFSPHSHEEHRWELSLDTSIPKWTVSANDMNVIMDWLDARESQLLKERKPSLSEQLQSAEKRTEQQKTAPAPDQEKDR